MDYKYIEQLLERYWECQATLEEEAILHNFFAQEDVPASLLPYRDLFRTEQEMGREALGDDFDQRVLSAIQVRSHRPTAVLTTPVARMTPGQRLRPFYRAAAMLAVVLTIGMAAQQGFQHPQESRQPLTAQPLAAQAEDTIRLFTDMPAPGEQTEAALPPAATDTLKGSMATP